MESLAFDTTFLIRQAGLRIGANDLWIAAVALEHDLPLVTGNIDETRMRPDTQPKSSVVRLTLRIFRRVT